VAVNPTVSSLDKLEAVIRNEAVYELAKCIPDREPGDAGRPREFPTYMPFIFEGLVSVYGSARKVEAELAHRYVWKMVRRLVKKVFPNNPEMHLPAYRYRRFHYAYFRNTYMTDPVILERIQETHRRLAAEQARELGLMDPDGEGSFTHPSLDRLCYADGKVVAPLYKAKPGDTRVDRETGEIKPVRFEADADLHFQGDGEMAYGVKFLMTAMRTSDVHGRIILDAQHVTGKGGEATTALKSFHAIAPHAPGLQGAIYDTALRGVHHAEMMRDLGWLSINRVQAQSVATNKGKAVQRVEKAVHVEDKIVNGKTVRLFAQGGGICIAELTDTGEQNLVPLKRTKTVRRENKDGTFRWHNEYEMPTGEKITVRLVTSDEDRERKLNRSENVRQLPPGSDDFKRIYRRRNDIESINRALDDSMFLGRAHSKGAVRQLVNLIGYALMVNGLAVHLHRKRRSVEDLETKPDAA
jgi:hypothetical protein